MMFRIPFLSLFLFGANAAHRSVPLDVNAGDIKLDSDVGRHLMQHARALEQNQEIDNSFLVKYSVKFQGCHHVQQWNSDYDEENDVRIKTKRLVRFRLCPVNDCSAESAGCTSKYGDYVVDMNTFVTAYLNAREEEGNQICQQAAYNCNNQCNGGGDYECVEACYAAYDLTWCLYEDNDGRKLDNEFSALDYAECERYELNNNGRRLEDANYYYEGDEYYLGPYCADQGGEIHLGLFTDDTCTTFAQNGEEMFYYSEGFQLPYSDDSLVSQMCLSCGMYNDNGQAELGQMCDDIYYLSGKCETRMSIDYPNESSCSYIQGIKIIREDGVIRTWATKKSKAASVCIGLFLTVAVLLAGYVYYLRTKLDRARVNLSASANTLT